MEENSHFEKVISTDEMKKKTKEYQTFVLCDIFSEYDLKEYMDGIKNIVQKDGACKEGIREEYAWDGYSWVYTNDRNLHCFLKEENNVDEDMKGEDHVKKENCLNLGNSDCVELECDVKEHR